MSPGLVELGDIRKKEPSPHRPESGIDQFKSFRIGGSMPGTDASPGKEIVDLSHPDRGLMAKRQAVKKGLTRWGTGEIPTTNGPPEAAHLAIKGPCNDPRYPERPRQQLTSYSASRIQLLDRHYPFVSRHLKDGIGRGVDDPATRGHVLGTEFVEDGGSTRGSVSNDQPPGPLREFCQKLVGKA